MSLFLIVMAIFHQEIDFEDLYNKATTSLVQFKAVKDSAFERFIELSKDSSFRDTTLTFLVSKFDTKSAMERHTLKNILKKVGKPAIPYITARLDYRGSDGECRSLKESLWILGEIGTEEIIEPVSKFIYDTLWQIRSGAFTALGKTKSRRGVKYILIGLNDTISAVRKSAYYALSQIATEEDVDYLIKGLSDPFYGVRYNAVEGLKRIGRPAVKPLIGAMGRDWKTDYFIALALQKIGAEKVLRRFSNHSSAGVRYFVYKVLADKRLIKKESHPLLKNISF